MTGVLCQLPWRITLLISFTAERTGNLFWLTDPSVMWKPCKRVWGIFLRIPVVFSSSFSFSRTYLSIFFWESSSTINTRDTKSPWVWIAQTILSNDTVWGVHLTKHQNIIITLFKYPNIMVRLIKVAMIISRSIAQTFSKFNAFKGNEYPKFI